MHRNCTVLAISILNGFCIFLLCARLWRIDRSEILTPAHSISIALIAKILYNLMTDKGRLTIDFLWNTSLLIVYSVFSYATDQHELMARAYVPPYSATYYLFYADTAVEEPINYQWKNYKLIVSAAFLVLVLYNPFVFKRTRFIQSPKVDEYLIMKYRRLLKRKNVHRHRDLQENRYRRAASPRQTQSHHILNKPMEQDSASVVNVPSPKSDESMGAYMCYSGFGAHREPSTRSKSGDQSTSKEQITSKDSADGFKDSKPGATGDNVSQSVGNSVTMCNTTTQTDVPIHPKFSSRSRAIQCRRPIKNKGSKSVTSRPAGPSTPYFSTNRDRATNTTTTITPRSKSRAKTKTKSTSPKHTQKHIVVKNKHSASDREDVLRTFRNMRDPACRHGKHSREAPRKHAPAPAPAPANAPAPLPPAPMTHKEQHPPIPMPTSQEPKAPSIQPAVKLGANRSVIFKLDDLINAAYGVDEEIVKAEVARKVQCLDVVPIREVEPGGVGATGLSLNVLYTTDKGNGHFLYDSHYDIRRSLRRYHDVVMRAHLG